MKKIAVIGAGTMGNGIAHVFAQYEHPVTLIDVSEKALEKGLFTINKNLDRQVEKGVITAEQKLKTLERITAKTSVIGQVEDCDLVVEAAAENLEIKSSIFKQLNDLVSEKAILATNTSSISITRIASVTTRPERVIGMHFMNPVPVMKLVEVIKGYSTSPEVADTIMNLSKKVQKIPVLVNDYPGFVANRILMPMINEAIFTVFEGVAGVEETDTVMRLGMAHPMGPLQLADFIGLDVCLSILNIMNDGFGQPKYAPCPLLVNMVLSGNLGVKTGQGFYKYRKDSKELVVSDFFRR